MDLCNQLCSTGQLAGWLVWQKLKCWTFCSDFSAVSFIPVILIGTTDFLPFQTTYSDLDLGRVSQGWCKAKPVGFIFSRTFQAMKMKFEMVSGNDVMKIGHLSNYCSCFVIKAYDNCICAGAIKFGDKLAMSTCKELLSSLSSCDLPFQCAHGRPSTVPLISLTELAHTLPDKVSLNSILPCSNKVIKWHAW